MVEQAQLARNPYRVQAVVTLGVGVIIVKFGMDCVGVHLGTGNTRICWFDSALCALYTKPEVWPEGVRAECHLKSVQPNS